MALHSPTAYKIQIISFISYLELFLFTSKENDRLKYGLHQHLASCFSTKLGGI